MQPELERMAREAGLGFTVGMFVKGQWPPQLERFAMLVAQAENERCAQVCDKLGTGGSRSCAKFIRSSVPRSTGGEG